MPVAPVLTVSHVAGLVAVHVQPAVVVTVPDTVPPVAVTDCAVGETAKAHVVPFWEIVMSCPATVRLPVRGVVAVFAAATYVTGPLPLPVAPDDRVNQAAPIEALQAQPELLATDTLPLPPDAATD